MMRYSPILLAVLAPFAVIAGPTLKNSGFEDGGELPASWGKAVYGDGFVLRRDATGGRGGGACASLEGRREHGDRACFLQVSSAFAPEKGVGLRVWYKGEGQATGILRLRPVPGVEVKGNQYVTQSFQLPTPRTEWTEFVFEVGVPKEARAAEGIRAEVILYQRGEGVLRYDDVSLESLDDFQPKLVVASQPTICPRRPEDGRSVLQNPPDFWWSPQANVASYTIQLARTPDFAPEGTTTVDGILYNVYSHSCALAAGGWYWRVRFVDTDGLASPWLPAWRFVVRDDATPFPVPPAAEMLGRIPAGHPRIYATQAGLDAFRAPLQTTRKEWWESFARQLEGDLKQMTMEEPGPEFANHKQGGLTDEKVKLGQRLRANCSRATGRMQRLGFGYLLTGREEYAQAAVAQAVEMANWDTEGVTGYRNHDQVFRDIAWKLATVYDWCHDRMDETQRARVRAAVVARGAVLFRDFTAGQTIYQYPYDSHGITAYGFLGICAVALAHDSPEADEWFRFIGATYPAIFPPWGGEEGGWAQGCAYWKWSQPFAWWFFDALKSATGVDLYQKAFCRNDGWFKLYMHPPWSDRHHFGDGNHGPPGSADAVNMARMAKAYANPYFQWYADEITWQPSGIFSYWWFDEALPARPPADLPLGRYFPDIGWVAMHSDLADPDAVFLAFKSSPFGSFNHSQGDQNSFVLYAFGEPLLIDSGYYDWYGSPHDKGWTRQTKAHNAILVNGTGQPIFDITAKGRITRHFTSPAADMAVGDATAAYKGALTKAERTIFYLRPDLFVIVDELEAAEPAEFTWMLHAEREMELRADAGEILVERGQAKCLVKFLEPAGLVLAQSNQFEPPPTTPRPNEWHASATTPVKATKQRFVTVVVPFRKDAPEPQVSWDGDRIQRQGPGDATEDEVRFLNCPNAVCVLAQAKRGNGVHSFRSLPEDNLVVRLEANEHGLCPVAAWRDRAVEMEVVEGGGSLSLPEGQNEVRARSPLAPLDVDVAFTLDGEPMPWRCESMRTIDGGVLAWLRVPEDAPGGVRVELSVDGGAAVQLDRQPLRVGEVVWLCPGARLSMRSKGKALKVGVAFHSVVKDAPPVLAEVVEEPRDARRIEGEEYTVSGGGSAKVYTHRTFLSGGKGLEAEPRAGQWVEWTFTSAEAERLALVLKAAVFEENALRLVELDGKPLGGEYRLYQLPNTGGFGATPDQWEHLRVAELRVPAGKHVLRITTVARKANLDYLMLVPL